MWPFRLPYGTSTTSPSSVGGVPVANTTAPGLISPADVAGRIGAGQGICAEQAARTAGGTRAELLLLDQHHGAEASPLTGDRRRKSDDATTHDEHVGSNIERVGDARIERRQFVGREPV